MPDFYIDIQVHGKPEASEIINILENFFKPLKAKREDDGSKQSANRCKETDQ